jgi:hypothetical protein
LRQANGAPLVSLGRAKRRCDVIIQHVASGRQLLRRTKFADEGGRVEIHLERGDAPMTAVMTEIVAWTVELGSRLCRSFCHRFSRVAESEHRDKRLDSCIAKAVDSGAGNLLQIDPRGSPLA